MLLDKETNLIQIPYEYDKNEGGYIDYVEPFPLGTGLSSKVIRSGQPLLVGTLEEEIANGAYFPPEIIEKGSGFFSQSWLGVPIMASDQVLGLVALAEGAPHAFNQNHMRLLQTLSSNLGAAIENARLFAETQRLLKETEQRAAELTTVNTVSSAIASELDLNTLIRLVGEQTRSIFKADDAYVALFDSSTREWSVKSGSQALPLQAVRISVSRFLSVAKPSV
jgi:GAF domain-containing protein